MIKVIHVVMGNDFPAAVFDTLAAAEAYCDEKRKLEREQPVGYRRFIYWRVRDFYLNDENKEEWAAKPLDPELPVP